MSDSEEDSVGDSEESVDDLIDDDLADLLAQLQLEAARNPPSRKYHCGVCEEVGQHFINDCPEAARTGERTPYQGPDRMFGRYRCKKCSRLWLSGRSWANTTQDCRVCNIAIYPHSQRPLRKPKGLKGDKDKEHMSALCGKCREIGHSCVTH